MGLSCAGLLANGQARSGPPSPGDGKSASRPRAYVVRRIDVCRGPRVAFCDSLHRCDPLRSRSEGFMPNSIRFLFRYVRVLRLGIRRWSAFVSLLAF